jgi:hypothetical protein
MLRAIAGSVPYLSASTLLFAWEPLGLVFLAALFLAAGSPSPFGPIDF